MARPLLGQLGTQEERVLKQASCEVTVPADHIWAEYCAGGRGLLSREVQVRLVRVKGVEATVFKGLRNGGLTGCGAAETYHIAGNLSIITPGLLISKVSSH